MKGFRKETKGPGIQSREPKPAQKSIAFKDLPQRRRQTPRSPSTRKRDCEPASPGSGVHTQRREGMSQEVFGFLLLTCLLFFCSGMAVWAKWPEIKGYLAKHRVPHKR